MSKQVLIAFALMFSIQSGFSQLLNTGQDGKPDNTRVSGYFEGTEPFWDMEIRDNYFILHVVNDTVQDTLLLSKKQAHTETYAFQGEPIFGIVRKSDGATGCDLDITEKGNATHEIYFSYKNVTYMGCGELTVRQK